MPLAEPGHRPPWPPMDILERIVAHKRAVELPQLPPVDRGALRECAACLGFREALKRSPDEPVTVIAESKKGSPSKGIFTEDYDPVRNALFYVAGGAQCLSILTDERFFYGHLDHLIAVRQTVQIPIIRKDFIIDDRQVAEARLAGADCILLIVACLSDGQLRDLQGFAQELGMDVLVEVHDADEAERAVNQRADLVGVNNRNLKTFDVSLETTFQLLPGLRDEGRVVLSESGITTRADCQRLEAAGADGVLVGETFMRSSDPANAIRKLRGQLAL